MTAALPRIQTEIIVKHLETIRLDRLTCPKPHPRRRPRSRQSSSPFTFPPSVDQFQHRNQSSLPHKFLANDRFVISCFQSSATTPRKHAHDVVLQDIGPKERFLQQKDIFALKIPSVPQRSTRHHWWRTWFVHSRRKQHFSQNHPVDADGSVSCRQRPNPPTFAGASHPSKDCGISQHRRLFHANQVRRGH